MKQTRVATACAAVFAAGVLGGCAASTPAPPGATPAVGAMTPGMTMANGRVMGSMGKGAGGTPDVRDAAAERSAVPSSAATMVCSAEARGDIREALGVRDVPGGTSTWSRNLFTCTFELRFGAVRLSVKDLPSAPATTAYLARERTSLRAAQSVAGLTTGAFGAHRGIVVLPKDDHVLTVDATALPRRFGPQGELRFAFAYEIAADILGCWTGD